MEAAEGLVTVMVAGLARVRPPPRRRPLLALAPLPTADTTVATRREAIDPEALVLPSLGRPLSARPAEPRGQTAHVCVSVAVGTSSLVVPTGSREVPRTQREVSHTAARATSMRPRDAPPPDIPPLATTPLDGTRVGSPAHDLGALVIRLAPVMEVAVTRGAILALHTLLPPAVVASDSVDVRVAPLLPAGVAVAAVACRTSITVGAPMPATGVMIPPSADPLAEIPST